MEDLSADDDILSDILVDTLEFEPAISTHKMNPNYRGQRFDRNTVSQIVRKRIVAESDISAAINDLSKLGIVSKYLANKTQRQTASFQSHARRYLEAYLPDSGVEFALTTRYKRVLLEKRARAMAEAPSADPATEKPGEPSTSVAEAASGKGKERAKPRSSLDRAATSIGAAPAASEKADLCVLALRDFKPGDLITHCKGGLKDLTKSEDEALREEATSSRERRKDAEYKGVLGPGRDFSVIKSSRKGCSQLLLGPARFVNHDCNPNTEFYRLGTQMTFKVIRPIARNEEITTYYGDNYFEWGNSECMCATCELRGVGAFSTPSANSKELLAEPGEGVEGDDSASVTTNDGQPGGRRTSRRAGRSIGGSQAPSPSPTPSQPVPGPNGQVDEALTEAKSKRDMIADLKLAQYGPSTDRSDPYAEGAGPQCRCLTCGATFWAPEKWWTPDECPRCERHYKIFKADWPERVPTEGMLARKGSGRRKSDVPSTKEKENGNGTPSAKNGATSHPPRETSSPSLMKRARTTKSESVGAASPPAESARASPATPINLTPLRAPVGANERQESGSSSQAKKSTKPLHTALNHQVKSADSQDEDDIEQSLQAVGGGTPAAQRKVTPKAKVSGPDLIDSDDSDLTPESASDMDEDESLPARRQSKASKRIGTNGSSSGTSPIPMGPKMLGKNAKTDVLAQYWGAETSDRRARRKLSSHAPVTPVGLKRSEEPRRASAGASKRRSSADSDSDGLGPMPKRVFKRKMLASTSDQEDEGNGDDSLPKPVTKGHRKTSSMGDLSSIIGAKDNRPSSSERRSPGIQPKNPSRPSVEAAAKSPSTASNIPGLATTGVERTSESNLALFWSAGVGESRTRRQAQREPQTMTAQPPAKRSRPGSETSRSRTPEVKRPRGRLSKGPASEDLSPAPLLESRHDRPAKHVHIKAEDQGEDMDIDGEDNDDEEDDSEDEDGVAQGVVSDAGLPKPYMFPGLVGRTPGASGVLLPSAPLARPPFNRPDLATAAATAAARSNSPLAGPPRVGVPGQPIRRNLRWGSGKVSTSRPMSSTTPLGRPLLGPNGSPLQSSPKTLEPARVIQFPSRSPEQVPTKADAPSFAPTGAQAAVSAATLEPPVTEGVKQEDSSVPSIGEQSKQEPLVKGPTAESIASTGNKGQVILPDDAASHIKPEPVTLPQVQMSQPAETIAADSDKEVTRPALGNANKQALGNLNAADVLPVEAGPTDDLLTPESSPGSLSPSGNAQRRVSGRVRKPPEMAAGQIQYKGSLVKLAAQRAKEAKNAPSSPPSKTPRHGSVPPAAFEKDVAPWSGWPRRPSDPGTVADVTPTQEVNGKVEAPQAEKPE